MDGAASRRLVKQRFFGRQQQQRRPAERAVTEASGWVRRAYGQRAFELIAELANVMRAAETEAKIPRTEEPPTEVAGTARQILHDDLFELRGVLLTTEVSEDDHDRDLHLRAALSVAIGAASSLAEASYSQPTAAYLRVAKPAIDGVLSAAGEPAV
jgi:hypothetical protein